MRGPASSLYTPEMMRFLASFSLAAAVAASAAGQGPLWPSLSAPPAAGGGAGDAALLVGVERYDVVAPVPGAEAEIEDWRAYLTRGRGAPPENVAVLSTDTAGRDALLAAAADAARRAAPGGALWFVFAGHGAASADGRDGLLVDDNAAATVESVQEDSASLGEVLKALEGTRAATIAVIVDAAFSGRGRDGAPIVPGLRPPLSLPRPSDPRLVLLLAARGDQAARTLPGALRPAFSHLVLGGLRGWAARDGRVRAADLARYAAGALAAYGLDQTPFADGAAAAVLASSAAETGPDVQALAREQTAARAGAAATFEWVTLPSGTFQMGTDRGYRRNEEPARRVAIRSFQLARAPVTVAQWRRCSDAGVCAPLDPACLRKGAGDAFPAPCVNWFQARVFADWAGGRLPTEAEWEYAARGAGRGFLYPWGDEPPTCARIPMKGCPAGPACSRPSGRTPQGLCDMDGPVWEWTQDWYHGSYSGGPADGSAWEDPVDSDRINRGGLRGDPAVYARSVNRNREDPHDESDDMGVRLARDIP